MFEWLKRKKNKNSTNECTLLKDAAALKIQVLPGNAQILGTRWEQQDSFGFSDIFNKDMVEHIGVIAVVADGMGGLSMGKEASSTAVQAMLSAYENKDEQESVNDALEKAINAANNSVYQLARNADLEGKVGTTLVAAVIYKDVLYWISAGDSRIYLFRDNNLILLTSDHVYAKKLDAEYSDGNISLEEAQNHPERHALTSYLGLLELEELNVSSEPIPVREGDRVILCSDGLYNSLSEEEMILAVCGNSPQDVSEQLVETVSQKEKLNQDNATILILAYGNNSGKGVIS